MCKQIFIMIATVLATLNVTRARDAQGKEIIPKVEYYESNFRCVVFPRLRLPSFSFLFCTIIISHTTNKHQNRTSFPFECTFTPRSKQVETLIRQAVDSQSDAPESASVAGQS